MTKVAATFEQADADAVVSALGRMDAPGLDWKVSGVPGSNSRGANPFGIVSPSASGNGVRSADSGPAIAPPLFAAGATDGDNTGASGDAGDYQRAARDRGGIVLEVNAPDDMVDAVRALFAKHNAQNVTEG